MKEQLFRKVLCSERLPNKHGWYNCFCDDTYPTELGRFWFNGTKFCFKGPFKSEYKLLNVKWLEPVEDMGWVSVKDRLPIVFTSDGCINSISHDILIVDDDGKMAVGNYITFKDGSSPGWSPHGDDVVDNSKIVYWMPVPPLPKPDKND